MALCPSSPTAVTGIISGQTEVWLNMKSFIILDSASENTASFLWSVIPRSKTHKMLSVIKKVIWQLYQMLDSSA